MAEPNAPKVCSICGIDVSSKPRTKDPKGRYVCAECIEKAKTTKHVQQNPPKPIQPAASSSAEGGNSDNSFILEMGGKSLGSKGGKACPNCGRILAEDTVVCISCGYNTSTGKQMQVKVVKAKKEKGESSSGGGGGLAGLNASPQVLAAIYLVVVGGLIGAGLAMDHSGLYMAGLIVAGIGAFAIYVATVVFAFIDSGAGWGIGCLLCGIVQIVWIIKQCDRDLLKAMWFASVLASIAINIMSYSGVAPTGFSFGP